MHCGSASCSRHSTQHLSTGQGTQLHTTPLRIQPRCVTSRHVKEGDQQQCNSNLFAVGPVLTQQLAPAYHAKQSTAHHVMVATSRHHNAGSCRMLVRCKGLNTHPKPLPWLLLTMLPQVRHIQDCVVTPQHRPYTICAHHPSTLFRLPA